MSLATLPATFVGATVLGFSPFLQPLQLWDYWPWLLLPLCLGVSVVYKSVRVETMRRVPFEAVRATIYIILGMAAAALVLLLLVRWMAHD